MLVTREQQEGDNYANNSEYKQAVFHYNNSLTASKELGTYRNFDTEAGICRKLAYVYSNLGQYDSALNIISEAIILDSSSNNQLALISNYRIKGNIFLFKGDYYHGIPMLEKTLVMISGLENSIKSLNQKTVADTYQSLAEANLSLGRYSISRNYATRAYSIYESLKNENGKMESLLVLANISKNLGDAGSAIRRLNLSLEIAENEEHNTSRHHQALGEAYSLLGKHEQALREKLIALDQAKKSAIYDRIVWTIIGVGDAYASIGDTEKAERYFIEAKELREKGESESLALKASAGIRTGSMLEARSYYSNINSDVSASLASLRLAGLMIRTGKSDSAVQAIEFAENNFREMDIQEGTAQALLLKSEAFFNLNQNDQALKMLDQCLDLSTQEEIQWKAWYHKGLSYLAKEQKEDAVEALKKSVEIIESLRGNFTIDEFKSFYMEDKMEVYDKLIELLVIKGDFEGALAYSERARSRAFLDMIANREIAVKPNKDSSLIKKEQELRLQIQNLTKSLHHYELQSFRGLSRDQIDQELRNSRLEYTELIQKIKLRSPEYTSLISVSPPDYKEVQALLDDETLVINYWTGKNLMIIWLIGKDMMLTFSHNSPQKKIETMVRESKVLVNKTGEFRGGPGTINQANSSEGSAVKQFKENYRLLLKPLESIISQYENLCIIPHGALHLLPFQTCIDNSGKFLVEKYNLFYAPSLSVYENCLKTSHDAKNEFLALALGNLSLGEFSGLPGTKWEVEKISENFDDPVTRYENESTESFVKNNAANYNMIHLSTHGMLNADLPMFSFILFSPDEKNDGLLTVSEVFGMDLNARLVTLSACQTGLGKINNGDEMTGLSRAFIYAGASSVVVSLWSVADRPTALLMTKFYEYQKEFPLYKALSMAQRDIMKEYYAPFYWAPFQLIGKGK